MNEEEKKAIELLEELDWLYLDFPETECSKYEDAANRIISDYKRVLKENEELKEYIAIAPNLDEMTAVKYRNIREDAYIQGRAEEQQRAEQIIYENYIPTQKVKDKIEEYKNEIGQLRIERNVTYDSGIYKLELKREALQELLEKE